jgi:hypothetical protein
VAEYQEVVQNLGHVDIVVINSAWCSYTHDAKRFGRDRQVGFFNIADFMAALNRRDYWMYLNRHEIDQFEQRGWL